MRTVLKPTPWIMALFATLFLAACGTVEEAPPTHLEGVLEAQAIDTGLDAGDAFAFRPPLVSGPPVGRGAVDTFDNSLLEFLTIEICELQDDACAETLATFSSSSLGGAGLVLEQDTLYKAEWDLAATGAEVGATYRIVVLAAGLGLGSIDYVVDKRNRNRTLPITFRVENHPIIRTRILTEQDLPAVDVARILRDEFGLTAEDTAQLLADEDYSADDVGLALKRVFQQTAADAADILHRAEFHLGLIADTLQDVYTLSAHGVATIFEDTLQQTAEDLGGALLYAEYGAKDIVSALKDVYDQTAAEITAVFTEEFANSWFVRNVVGTSGEDLIRYGEYVLAEALQLAGFSAEEVANAFQDVLDLGYAAIADALQEAGFVIDDITGALDSLEGITTDLIAEALEFAGFSATQVASALKSTLDITLDQVANAVDDVFNLSDKALAGVLDAAGYATSELKDFFGDAWDDIEDGFCDVFGC